MKHGKNPTVAQCKLMEKHFLYSIDWLVVKDTPTEMVLVNRYNDRNTKVIHKEVKE